MVAGRPHIKGKLVLPVYNTANEGSPVLCASSSIRLSCGFVFLLYVLKPYKPTNL